MFLVEPPRSHYDINFSLAGVPVRVHPLFWLVTIMLVAMRENVKSAEVLIWVAAVFISILVHELGHAFLIRFYGWRPRVTLYMMGGLASYEPTWHRTWPQVAISFAGPAAGFLLAAATLAGVRLAGHEVRINTESLFWPVVYEPFQSTNLNDLVDDLLFVNIFWGFINLLPIYPLDGGKISREVLNHFNPATGIRQSLLISIFTACGLALVLFAKLGDIMAALFFASFAVINYQMLQQDNDRFGGRGW